MHFPLSEGISSLLSSSLDYDTFDECITSVTLRINTNSSTKVPMRSPSPLSIMLFATILATGAAATLSMNPLVLAQNNSSNASTTTTQPNATVKIQAGGGNSTIPYDAFYPKQIQIIPGQIVSWYNAAKVGEPHTVTFVTDNKTKAPLSAPFAVKNSSSFVAMPPGSNSEPVLLPNHQNPSMTMILASNARASSPAVIDSTGKAVHLGPNPMYSVKGDEKFINSGLFFPKGKGPPNASTSFTLTFEKAGVYNYY